MAPPSPGVSGRRTAWVATVLACVLLGAVLLVRSGTAAEPEDLTAPDPSPGPSGTEVEAPRVSSLQLSGLAPGRVVASGEGIPPLLLGRSTTELIEDGWERIVDLSPCERVWRPVRLRGDPIGAPEPVTWFGWTVDGQLHTAQVQLSVPDVWEVPADGPEGRGVARLGAPWESLEGTGPVERTQVELLDGSPVSVRSTHWSTEGARFAASDLGTGVVAWLEVRRAGSHDCELTEHAADAARALVTPGLPDLDLPLRPGSGPVVTPEVMGAEVTEVPGAAGVRATRSAVPSPCTRTVVESAGGTYLVHAREGRVVGITLTSGAVRDGPVVGRPLADAVEVWPDLEVTDHGRAVTAERTLADGTSVRLLAVRTVAELARLDAVTVIGPPVVARTDAGRLC